MCDRRIFRHLCEWEVIVDEKSVIEMSSMMFFGDSALCFRLRMPLELELSHYYISFIHEFLAHYFHAAQHSPAPPINAKRSRYAVS